jgi:hypothetical protein
MPGTEAKGHDKPDHPSHDRHMEHFDAAMKDALTHWDGGQKTVRVTLEATVSPNPGGVKEYFVTLGP